jgi:hypothetical protein
MCLTYLSSVILPGDTELNGALGNCGDGESSAIFRVHVKEHRALQRRGKLYRHRQGIPLASLRSLTDNATRSAKHTFVSLLELRLRGNMRHLEDNEAIAFQFYSN